MKSAGGEMETTGVGIKYSGVGMKTAGAEMNPAADANKTAPEEMKTAGAGMKQADTDFKPAEEAMEEPGEKRLRLSPSRNAAPQSLRQSHRSCVEPLTCRVIRVHRCPAVVQLRNLV